LLLVDSLLLGCCIHGLVLVDSLLLVD